MKKLLVVLALMGVLVGLLAMTSNAQKEIGQGAFASMKAGYGAACLALAGTCVAAAQDFTAAYWNAAFLASLNQLAGLAGANRFGLVYSTYTAAVWPMPYFTLGTALAAQITPDIPVQTTNEPRGELISDLELAALGSAAFSFTIQSSSLQTGATLKYYRHDIGSLAQGKGWGMDVGLLYQPSPNMSLGISSSDILGTRIHWSTKAIDQVNQLTRIGFAYNTGIAKLVGQMEWESAFAFSKTAYSLGAEMAVLDQPLIVLRGGVKRSPNQPLKLSAGAGLTHADLRADFAYVAHAALGPTYILSFQLSF